MSKFTIQVTVMGLVSAGKSTFTNSMLGWCACPSGLVATTVRPAEFVVGETPELKASVCEANDVDLLAKMRGSGLSPSDLRASVQYVEKIDITRCPIPEQVSLRVCDLPGLDDASSRELFRLLAKKYLSGSDIVVLVVDVFASLKIAGEMSILELILDGIAAKAAAGACTQLIVLYNKCDEVQEINGVTVPENKELYAMFVLTQTTVKQRVDAKWKGLGLPPVIFTCISARAAFLDRAVRNGRIDSLTDDDFNLLGKNAFGKAVWRQMRESKDGEDSRVALSEALHDQVIQHDPDPAGWPSIQNAVDKAMNSRHQAMYLLSAEYVRLREVLSKQKNSINISDVLAGAKLSEGRIIEICEMYDIKYNPTRFLCLLNQRVKHWAEQAFAALGRPMSTKELRRTLLIQAMWDRIHELFPAADIQLDGSIMCRRIVEWETKMITQNNTIRGDVFGGLDLIRQNSSSDGFESVLLQVMMRAHKYEFIEFDRALIEFLRELWGQYVVASETKAAVLMGIIQATLPGRVHPCSYWLGLIELCSRQPMRVRGYQIVRWIEEVSRAKRQEVASHSLLGKHDFSLYPVVSALFGLLALE